VARDQGGWESPRIEEHFERYVIRVLDEYKAPGALVADAETSRSSHTFKSYLNREWPPGKSSYPAALKVMRTNAARPRQGRTTRFTRGVRMRW